MALQGGEDVYATLLLNDTYLPGALVLAHSLRDAGTTKKLAVLVTLDTVSAEVITMLKTVYDYVIPVPRMQNGVTPGNLDLMNRPDLHSTFTKVNLWRQGQFRKIVYIDADVVAYRAPDELFDLPHVFAAAPDIGWPDLFNTGLMVITPDIGEYHALLALAQRGVSFDGADQGLLNMHFGASFHRLPFTYNVTPSAHYQYLPAYRHFQSNVSLVHFIGADKPWLQGRDASTGSGTYNEMAAKWWSVYDRHYRKATPPPGSGESPSQPPEIVQYFVKGEFQPTFTRRLTTDEPSIDLGSSSYDQVRGHHEGTYQPPAEHQHESHQPPQEASWDAQWQPPPANAKPEAMNFPQAHYEMSRDVTPFVPPERYPSPPRDMWYEVPKEAPQSPYQRPAPIFPWEAHQPAPTRVFAGDTASSSTEPGQWGSHPHHAYHASGAEPSMTADSPSVDLRTEPTTPTMTTTSHVLPPSDPWASFTRTNAWDDVPQIERYVDSFQKKHRRMRSRGLGSGSSGEGGSFYAGGRGSKITDFPSEVERPSLPVTPAPVRRQKSWAGGGPGFGDDGDAESAAQRLPAAEGVPQQVDWDPVVQLQKLAREQSEMLLQKLGHGKEEGAAAGTATRDLPIRSVPAGSEGVSSATYVSQTVAPVLSPKPVKPGGLETSSVRNIDSGSYGGLSISKMETTIEEPAYSGPGPSFEKDEVFPTHDQRRVFPTDDDEMDAVDT